MDAKVRIRELMQERGWSECRLAIASGLSQSTVANIFNRNTTPSVNTLEAICQGFGITLAQFFAKGDMVELTPEQRPMFEAWSSLTKPQKDALYQLISVMENAKSNGKRIGRPQTTKENIPTVFYKHYPAFVAGTMNVSELARVCGLSRPTVYKYLKMVG